MEKTSLKTALIKDTETEEEGSCTPIMPLSKQEETNKKQDEVVKEQGEGRRSSDDPPSKRFKSSSSPTTETEEVGGDSQEQQSLMQQQQSFSEGHQNRQQHPTAAKEQQLRQRKRQLEKKSIHQNRSQNDDNETSSACYDPKGTPIIVAESIPPNAAAEGTSVPVSTPASASPNDNSPEHVDHQQDDHQKINYRIPVDDPGAGANNNDIPSTPAFASLTRKQSATSNTSDHADHQHDDHQFIGYQMPVDDFEAGAGAYNCATPSTPAFASPAKKQAALSSSSSASRIARQNSSGSVASSSSGLSSSSATSHNNRVLSPTPFGGYCIPPAPPSTPASASFSNQRSLGSAFSSFDENLLPTTPLPFQANVHNSYQLELAQQMAEGAETPAPTHHRRRSSSYTPASASDGGATNPAGDGPSTTGTASSTRSNPLTLSGEDFSEWAVGDRYRLIRILGRGSYGEVAQAIDLYDGRPDAYVAIKRILSPFDQEVDAVRLYREIHILRKLCRHDCIIALLDVVQPPTDDLDDFHDLYLVFEYVDTDLYKLIMSPQYLTTEHIQTFLYQMLTGLKYLHSSSVIHRDLKPANILLNEDCSLKICDFGLARIVNRATSNEEKGNKQNPDTFSTTASPTRGKMRRQLTKHVVTRWYRAPELILIQPYTSAVDIWSLGCILAELLSMQEGSVPGYQDRKPLFPGGTCYPLSGDLDSLAYGNKNNKGTAATAASSGDGGRSGESKSGKSHVTVDSERLDQLSVIFGIIGTPSPEDIAAFDGGNNSNHANEYIESMKKMPGKPLEELYPKADPAAIDLLKKMLKFNPKLRCTAEQALEHKFFQGVRRPELEREVSEPLVNPEFLESPRIDLDTLKRKTYEEILWYRDNGLPNSAKKGRGPAQAQATTTTTATPQEIAETAATAFTPR